MAKKNKAEMYGPTRRHFNPTMQAHGSHMAATAAKAVADACGVKLRKLKKELKTAVKEAHKAESQLKRCRGSKSRSQSHSAPKARKKSSKRSSGGHREKIVTLASLTRGASRGNKTWVCKGPVRTGCGGSTGKVAKGRKAC